MKKRAYYHIYTKGTEDDVIFRSRSDYVTGMNFVAINTRQIRLDMLAFVLMSNHFHFVVYATHDEAVRFINMYKQRLSIYLRHRYGISKPLSRLEAECTLIDLRDEGLKKIIAYILNNPVKAGINCQPQNYEWSTCRYYFSDIDRTSDLISLDQFGTRKLRSILHSRYIPSGNMKLNSDFYIDPSSYVNIRAVENLFKKASSLEYFLVSSRKSGTKGETIAFSDQLVLNYLTEILEKKYDSLEVKDLPSELRSKIISELKSKFHSNPRQLGRVMNMDIRDILLLSVP